MADSKIVKEARALLASYRKGEITPMELISRTAGNPEPLARLLCRTVDETNAAISSLHARAAKLHPGSSPFAMDARNKAVADSIAAAPGEERKRRAEERAQKSAPRPSPGVVRAPLAEPGPDLSKQSDTQLVALLRASLPQATPAPAVTPHTAPTIPAPPVAAVASATVAVPSATPVLRVLELGTAFAAIVARIEREHRPAKARAPKTPRAPRKPRLRESSCPRCIDRARYMTEQRAYRKARDAAKAAGDAVALAAAMATMPKLRLPPGLPDCARCEERFGKRARTAAANEEQTAAA